MVSRIVSTLKAPFAAYLSLTVSEPCKAIANASREKMAPIRSARTRKSTDHQFSLRKHIQNQNKMTSPNTGDGTGSVNSIREYYFREIPLAPITDGWMH